MGAPEQPDTWLAIHIHVKTLQRKSCIKVLRLNAGVKMLLKRSSDYFAKLAFDKGVNDYSEKFCEKGRALERGV